MSSNTKRVESIMADRTRESLIRSLEEIEVGIQQAEVKLGMFLYSSLVHKTEVDRLLATSSALSALVSLKNLRYWEATKLPPIDRSGFPEEGM